MAPSILACLTSAGVVERAGRHRSILRVTPRFLAHAEGTAGRFRTLGRPGDEATVLETALATWDDYHHATHDGARVLQELLDDRHQAGALLPVFPAIEQFAVAA